MCFELFLDLSNVKLSEIMKIKFIDNMIADNSNLYIWSNDESIDKKKLLSKLKRIGITDVYCKELSLKDIDSRNDFVSTWFHEQYTESYLKKFESEHQQELVDMQKNIQKAKSLIKQRVACEQKEG
ncbi:MAG TPA: hypothetical protein DCW90_01580 [Lachnospiraceae bacterium]|nr:hypothetical protein [Lachnospiraceae bacterium]